MRHDRSSVGAGAGLSIFGETSFSVGASCVPAGTACSASASDGLRLVYSVTSTQRPAELVCVLPNAFFAPCPPPNMPPIIDIGLAPGPPPMPGMPNPENVATSIHACDTGGFTTWVGPLPACAPATPATSARPIPSHVRFRVFILPSGESDASNETNLPNPGTTGPFFVAPDAVNGTPLTAVRETAVALPSLILMCARQIEETLP